MTLKGSTYRVSIYGGKFIINCNLVNSTCRNYLSSRLICQFDYDGSRIQLFIVNNAQRHIQPPEVT
jgi:hypothetical protein